MLGHSHRSVAISAVCAALLTALAGCGGKTKTVTSVSPPPPTPPETQSTSAPPPAGVTLSDYTASLYTARIPSDWTQEEDDKQVSTFRESRWRDPRDPVSSLTIDALSESTSPADKAATVRADTSRASGYRELSFASAQVAGQDAFKWSFELSGTQRVDYFLNQCGIGIAVLGSTSRSRFEELAPTFRRIAGTVKATCTSPPTTSTSTTGPTVDCPAEPDVTRTNDCPPDDPSNPPADFCTTHTCIGNFGNGTGTTVQCSDGEWSDSGGNRGACSYHGGESSNPPGPPPSY